VRDDVDLLDRRRLREELRGPFLEGGGDPPGEMGRSAVLVGEHVEGVGMKELHRQGAEALKALSEYGGTVLKTSLSEDAERQLQEALHGTPVAA
jgi:hypothetical protein